MEGRKMEMKAEEVGEKTLRVHEKKQKRKEAGNEKQESRRKDQREKNERERRRKKEIKAKEVGEEGPERSNDK